jgi:hypothetical protein
MFVVKKLLMHVCVAVCSSDEDKLPSVSFEMKGGAAYDVFSPILVFDTSDGSFQVYCLAVLKQVNADFSIIGRSFLFFFSHNQHNFFLYILTNS